MQEERVANQVIKKNKKRNNIPVCEFYACQLSLGIRFFDVRVRFKGDEAYVMHNRVFLTKKRIFSKKRKKIFFSGEVWKAEGLSQVTLN